MHERYHQYDYQPDERHQGQPSRGPQDEVDDQIVHRSSPQRYNDEESMRRVELARRA
jgi:hypothetical protein